MVPLFFALLIDDIIGAILEVIADVLLSDVILIALFYTPGYAALKPMTVGKYPPGFYAEKGKAPCYLLGVTLWAAGLFALVPLFGGG